MNLTLIKKSALNNLFNQYLSTPNALLQFPGSSTIVFGEGNSNAHLVFIGEGPGQQEDEQGRPFVGKSGKLLNKLLDIANLSREEVYITNIVKTRPPNNRKPTLQEIAFSMPLLIQQLNIIQPRLVCTLGSSALQGFTSNPISISQARGEIITINDIKILPTYHPAYILRNPKELKQLADDIIKAANYVRNDP